MEDNFNCKKRCNVAVAKDSSWTAALQHEENTHQAPRKHQALALPLIRDLERNRSQVTCVRDFWGCRRSLVTTKTGEQTWIKTVILEKPGKLTLENPIWLKCFTYHCRNRLPLQRLGWDLSCQKQTLSLVANKQCTKAPINAVSKPVHHQVTFKSAAGLIPKRYHFNDVFLMN